MIGRKTSIIINIFGRLKNVDWDVARVSLIGKDVSDEHLVSIFRVEGIYSLGKS
jgi:hypothetical protein